MLRRRLNRFAPRKKSSSAYKWFIFGLILGAVVLFFLFGWRRETPIIQLVVSTPAPPETQNPEELIWSESGNIGVSGLKPQALVRSPLVVKGMARVFENTFNLRLKAITKDKKTNQTKEEILVETTAQAQPRDAGFHGPFEARLEFSTSAKEGILEVFDYSAKDGKEIDKVSIPVKF